jgi:outer membrane receptor protein involved in Fe transport
MFKDQPYVGGDEYDCAGLFGPICGTPIPKWRHKLRVTWTSPWDVDFSAQWRYMSSVSLDVNSTTEPTFAGYCGGGCYDFQDAKVSAYNYLDLSASWTIRDGLTLNFGVNNVFDKNPPTLDSENIGVTGPPFGNGGTYPQVYDSLGRMLFADVVIKY